MRTTPGGLTQAEAEQRARTTGPNEVAQDKPQGWPVRLLKIIRNPLVILLATLSAVFFATGDLPPNSESVWPERTFARIKLCNEGCAAKASFVPGALATAAAGSRPVIPGTPPSKYSNYGYLLLSAIVEQVTGIKFFDYVWKTLLQPFGITQVLLSSTLAGERTSNQAICEDEGLGLSPLDPKSPLLIPAVYGGDGQIKEVAAGCAGLAASATAITQFIHLHAAWGNGPRVAEMAARSGATSGASTWAESRRDDIDWALTVNTRGWPPQHPSPTLGDLQHEIDTLLNSTSLP